MIFPVLSYTSGLGRGPALGDGGNGVAVLLPCLRHPDLLLDTAHAAREGGIAHDCNDDEFAASGEGDRQYGAGAHGVLDGVPFYWMIATSLKHDKEIYGYEATLIPQQPTLANYITIIRDTPYLLYLRNSVVVAVSSTLLAIVIASLGAYAIARLNFPGRAALARGLVCTYLVPPSLLFIPLFAMMSTLRLTDTLYGLTFAYLGGDVPFCTWLLMGYFRSVPVELEEAALVDGCNRVTALIRVVLPVCSAGPGGGDVLLVHPGLE